MRLIFNCQEGRLRLYASQNDLYNGDYSEVNFSGPHIDLSQANVYAGAAHFILLMKGEAGRTLVYGVGDNRFFQQGHQGPSSWTKATLLEFFDEGTSSILKVACGDLHTAFLTEDGALYMSGSNANGQCGGFSEQEPCLVTFKVEDGAESDIDVIDIACGANHTLAYTSQGLYVAGLSM